MQVQKLTGSKITSLSNEAANLSVYYTETADQEDLYLMRYGTAYEIYNRPMNPEEEVFRYVENLYDPIREAIKEGYQMYVCEEIQEQLDMIDSDGDFWQEILEEIKEAAI